MSQLVRTKAVDNLYYNQLLLNHTHEGVDATFGSGSQFLRALHSVVTPVEWYRAMQGAFANQNGHWNLVCAPSRALPTHPASASAAPPLRLSGGCA
jgi:hypothetical protein